MIPIASPMLGADEEQAVLAVVERQTRLNQGFEEGRTLELSHPFVSYNCQYIVCIRYDFPNSGELERQVIAESRKIGFQLKSDP